MSADRPAVSDGVPVVSHTQHLVGDHTSLCRAAHLLFDRCATAPETRPLLAVSVAHPARDVDRLSSGVRRGEAMIPRPVVRGPMDFALPRSRSPIPSPRPFWACHYRLC